MLPPKLDYLFVCDFLDGSRYFQNPSDASVEHPLRRSAYWDVCQRLDQVSQFTLIDRHRQHEHAVYLSDGHFKTDGKIIPCPRTDLENFRLIYFRRVQQKLENEEVLNEARTKAHHPKPYIVAYCIGWQANRIGTEENFQMRLLIPPLGSLEKVGIERKG